MRQLFVVIVYSSQARVHIYKRERKREQKLSTSTSLWTNHALYVQFMTTKSLMRHSKYTSIQFNTHGAHLRQNFFPGFLQKTFHLLNLSMQSASNFGHKEKWTRKRRISSRKSKISNLMAWNPHLNVIEIFQT